MFKNINAGLISSRASFLTNRNRLLYTRLIKNSSGQQFYNQQTGYIYHIFTSPGSFQVHTPGYVDIMIVGGGGGGGGATVVPTSTTSGPHPHNGGGGGGAGGVGHWYNKYIPNGDPDPSVPYPDVQMPGTYTVSVGSGGAGGSSADMLDNRPPNPNTVAYSNYYRRGENGTGSWVGAPPNTPNSQTIAERRWGMQLKNTAPQTDTVLNAFPTGFSYDPRWTMRLAVLGGGGGGAGGSGGVENWQNIVPIPHNPEFLSMVSGQGIGDVANAGGTGHWLYRSITGTQSTDPDRVIQTPNSLPNNVFLQTQPGPGYAGGAPDASVTVDGYGVGGGGGGGAGSAGRAGNQSGTDDASTQFSGAGGAGVAAFGGDIGIPFDYGTSGPASDPTVYTTPMWWNPQGYTYLGNTYYTSFYETKTRWFGGGGHGGYNDNWRFTGDHGSLYHVRQVTGTTIHNYYGAINGYIGGGGASFGPPSVSGANNPDEFSDQFWPFASHKNGIPGTGGGGCGAACNGPTTLGAGSGGSGIVIIRYQAQL